MGYGIRPTFVVVQMQVVLGRRRNVVAGSDDWELQ